MADYNPDLDPEKLEPCPYDKVHMVRRKRMQYHLMKCRKNHPNKEFKTCPFNACHEMPQAEFRYHMATCPDRHVLEKDIAYAREKESGEGNLFKGCTDVPAYNSYEVDCSESWDEEVNPHPRIGVREDFMDKLKFKNTMGMTPAQKRYFHRTLNPEHNVPTSVQAPATSQVNKENEKPMVQEDKLRLPKNTSKAFSMYQNQVAAPVQPRPMPSTVFAYSLAQCGIGRGRGAMSGALPTVGRGRSMGGSAGIQQYILSDPGVTHGSQPVDNRCASPQTQPTPIGLSSSATPPSVPRATATTYAATAISAGTSSTDAFAGVHIPTNVFPDQSRVKPVGRGRQVTQPSYDQVNSHQSFHTSSINGMDAKPQWPENNRTSSAGMGGGPPASKFPDSSEVRSVGRGKTVSQAAYDQVNSFPSAHANISNGMSAFSEWPSLGSYDASSAGLGRGSLSGESPAFIIPKLNNGKPSKSLSYKDYFESTSSGSGSGTDSSDVHGFEEAKKRKQIQKKLRQINALETKMSSGQKLNTEEEIKLSNKCELEEQLAALSL